MVCGRKRIHPFHRKSQDCGDDELISTNTDKKMNTRYLIATALRQKNRSQANPEQTLSNDLKSTQSKGE